MIGQNTKCYKKGDFWVTIFGCALMMLISVGAGYVQLEALNEYEHKGLKFLALPIVFIIISNIAGGVLSVITTSYNSRRVRILELRFALNHSDELKKSSDELAKIIEDINNAKDITEIDYLLNDLYKLHCKITYRLKKADLRMNSYSTTKPRVELLEIVNALPFSSNFEYICYELNQHTVKDYREYFQSEITYIYRNRQDEAKVYFFMSYNKLLIVFELLSEKIEYLHKIRHKIIYGDGEKEN